MDFSKWRALYTDDDNFRPMRVGIANVLLERGHDVEIWSHLFPSRKAPPSYRTQILCPEKDLKYVNPFTRIQKNIGIGRLYDHGVFAYNLLRTLNKQNFISPDGYLSVIRRSKHQL